ncbi:hypothetical protein GCM10009662_02250 [Catellatospora coxensis]
MCPVAAHPAGPIGLRRCRPTAWSRAGVTPDPAPNVGDQLAVQVTAGIPFVPFHEPRKPKFVLAPADRLPL